MATVPEKKTINTLTATRAVAAIMVFVHHMGGDIVPFSLYPSVFHIGNIAVGYFFVLSGFVLYLSYRDKEIRYSDYIKRRLARIMPIYLLALVMTIGVSVAINDYQVFSARSLKEIGLSIFCLQSFVPGYPTVLNFPAWSISVEMFFYVLFPFLLLLQKGNLKVFVLLTIVLFAASQYFNLRYTLLQDSVGAGVFDIITYSPQIHLSQFLVGMLGGYLYGRLQFSFPRFRWLPLVAFALVMLVVAYRPQHISYQVGLIAPLFMVLILVIAINNPKWLNARPLVFLGEISYGIYILQHPVYTILDNANSQYIHISKTYFFYCSLAALILVASVTYYLVEMPVRRFMSSSFAKKARASETQRV